MKGFNIKRMRELMEGEMPEGLHEELFVLGFNYGINGMEFIDLLNSVSEQYQEYTYVEQGYKDMGYAYGQKTYNETMEQAPEMFINGKKTTH